MSEIRQLLKLAWPLLLTQLTASLMFFTDTVMSARLSHVDMAAVSIATGLWVPLFFTAQGLIIAVTPIVAHLYGGQKDGDNIVKMTKTLVQGGYLSLFISVIIISLIHFVHVPLDALDLDPKLQSKAQQYLNFVVWGMLPGALFFVLRGFCEGISQTKPALVVSLIALLVNIPLNYIFVFGKFGAPQLGGAGSGLATAIVQWISLICLIIYFFVSTKLKPYLSKIQYQPVNFKAITNLIKVGTPIALAYLFESTLFACTALFIAPLGAVAVAGHQVAFSYSSVVFMVPLSLAMAATIRVGYLRGFGDYQKLLHSIKVCFLLAAVVGFCIMLITYLFKDQIIAIYSSEPEVVTLSISILFIAAIYQFPDAIQVMAAGIFKGLKITKPLFYITLISYWPLGFCLGYVLGRTDLIVPAMGPQGFWYGIVFGLTCASVLFIWRLYFTLKTVKQQMSA